MQQWSCFTLGTFAFWHFKFKPQERVSFSIVIDKLFAPLFIIFSRTLHNIIKKLFTPEFRNRLDSIVQFKALDPAVMVQVVDKFIFELEAQLQEQQVTIEVDEAARLWLAEHGHDEKMGARPMARIIQQHIKKPLAEELLFGRLAHGGHLIVQLEDGELAFEIQEKETVRQ